MENFFCIALEQQQLYLSKKQLQLCLDFIVLLKKWNKVYNITSITDEQEMIKLHLLDSLSLVPLVNKLIEQQSLVNQPISFIDVGTGGGLPGVPLAIFFPQYQFTLLDARSKKIQFLQQLKQELALSNINPMHKRVEEYQPENPYHFVLSRAFASLEDMLSLCSHLCHTNGLFIAMKGQEPLLEMEALKGEFQLILEPLSVPSLAAKRCAVVIRSKK